MNIATFACLYVSVHEGTGMICVAVYWLSVLIDIASAYGSADWFVLYNCGQ